MFTRSSKLFYSIVACSIVVRLVLAPFSSHGDIECFWLSAQRFTVAGFDFYYFMHTRAGMWVYPPVWLWLATGAYSLSLSSQAYDPSFLFLVKIPMIVADVTMAYVLYLLLGPEKGKFAAAFWLINPMSIFVTSIFGQFDPLIPALLMLSVLGLTRDKVIPSGVVYGVAIMTKQYAIFAAPVLIATVLRKKGFNRAARFALAAAATAFLISFPFLLSGARQVYFREVWMTRSTVAYDDQCCQFAGIFQFFSWIHENFRIDTLPLFNLSYPSLFLMLGLATGLSLCCVKMDYMRGCLVSMAAFLTLSWYVNPQYTVVFIPFMIYDVLAHKVSKYWLVTTLLPFMWVLSVGGFGPYFGGRLAIPPLGSTVVTISAVIFFIFLLTYIMLRMGGCTTAGNLSIHERSPAS